jgi:hypothetical protein
VGEMLSHIEWECQNLSRRRGFKWDYSKKVLEWRLNPFFYAHRWSIRQIELRFPLVIEQWDRRFFLRPCIDQERLKVLISPDLGKDDHYI